MNIFVLMPIIFQLELIFAKNYFFRIFSSR